MVLRNPNLEKFSANYLFAEIKKRKQQFLNDNPNKKLISLSIGDTILPLVPKVVYKVVKTAVCMGTYKGYKGYGDEQGEEILREKIVKVFYKKYNIKADEVFISDGCKCDIGRLQVLFGNKSKLVVQDPSYPAYVDSAVLVGMTGNFIENTFQYKGITYLTCLPENNFFPELSAIPTNSIIYFCSPNNPTGIVYTKDELAKLVIKAKETNSIIVFDAAYSAYVQDTNKYPTSIYEIPEAKGVAIELNSFSKLAGFTGVRLGWAVIPSQIKYADGTSVRDDYRRVVTTIFNGASIFSQYAGLAVLTNAGLKQVKKQVNYYLENAKLLRSKLIECGFECYGGLHSPYLWIKHPKFSSSWQAFDYFLNELNIMVIPGVGFGPAGEGFVRLSSFVRRKDILEALDRISQKFL